MVDFYYRKIFFIIILFALSNSIRAVDNNIKVLVKNTSAPYLYFDEKQEPQGFVFDILQILKNNESNFTFFSDSGQLESSDFLYAHITKNEVPLGYYFLELPHSIDYYVFTRKNNNIKSQNNLFNKKIIVLKNDLPYQILYKNKTSHILKVRSYNEALRMLAAGINDCAIIPFQIGVRIIKEQKFKNIDYIITPFLSYEYGIAIPEEKTDIIQQFKLGLHKGLKSNEYKLIEKKWFVHPSANEHEWGNSFDKVLLTVLITMIIVIVLLIIFIWLLIREISASTHDYINEISQSNISPLSIDLNNPLVNKLFSSVSLWLFVNDINGKIHQISQELLLDVLNTDIAPDNLKVSDLFDNKTAELLASFDQKLTNQKSYLISEQIQFEIGAEKFNKWLLKYPLQIKGNNKLLYLNILVKPIIRGEGNLRDLSFEFLFNSVIDALPDLIYIKNTKGEYLSGNKAFLKFCGKSEGEIVSKSDFQIFNKDKAEQYTKTDDIVFKSGAIWESQDLDNSHKGDIVKFENIKIPLHNKKNEIFGLVGISHDITKQDKYEQELDLARKKAEESDRIKSSFMVNMSHEIRTPMNSIIGFSDLLADSDLTFDQRIEIIDMIQSNGHTLIDLIDDIINFSRIEAGHVHLKFSSFNLNDVIKDAYDYGISKKTQLNKEHLNLTYTIGSIEDEFMIHSDPFRLRQVLKNLLNSSIRFSTSENLFLGYTILKDKLLIYIKNDNNFISDDTAKKMFDDQILSQYNFSDIEESAGIALIIAKNVIEMIDGKMYSEEIVSGKPDYYFTIPLKRSKLKKSSKTKHGITEIPTWSNKCILIAEDEDLNYLLLEEMLSKTEVEIIRANNGNEAIELFEKNISKINLVLMDIRMPEINGADASRKILEIAPDTIIIAQTAYALPEDKELYLSLGINFVLSKPINPSELYYVCNKHLSDK